MDKHLRHLITDYLASVRVAVELMQQSGVPMPATCMSWVKTDIPHLGELKDGTRYRKHGYGCAVHLRTGEVDFDFGDLGQIDGFDAWRLVGFAGSKLEEYGFKTKGAIDESFKAAVKLGTLVYSAHSLYYVAGSERTLAIEICRDFPNDLLPHFAQDKVLLLYTKCFLAADLMRKNYEKLSQKWNKNDYLSQNDKINLEIYFSTWLGYLGATCEGFNKLRMRSLLKDKRPESFYELIPQCDDIYSLLKLHSDSLRKLRNNVFHPRDDIKPILLFAADDAGRLAWAREVHDDIAKFFSAYRVQSEVHYLMNSRLNESHIRQTHPKRRKAAVEPQYTLQLSSQDR